MKKQLIEFLEKLNIDENGELLGVDTYKYVDKIEKNATIISIEKNARLIAFIAYYENDSSFDLAFLTMLAVDTNSKKMGYGKSLLEISIKEIEKKGFKRYGLEVRKKNIKVIQFYEKYGFVCLEDRKNDFIYMEKTF